MSGGTALLQGLARALGRSSLQIHVRQGRTGADSATGGGRFDSPLVSRVSRIYEQILLFVRFLAFLSVFSSSSSHLSIDFFISLALRFMI